jgi:tryptophan halogenase
VVQSVLVLGGGSAGFLVALTLKHRLPRLQVTVLRSRELGIIGVGEGTTITVPQHLHSYLNIDLAEFYRVADPMWKLGIRFLWGPRPYFDYAFGFQLDTQYQMLPRGTGYYVRDGGFDYVGVPSGLMTHNHVFVRGPNGAPLIGGDVAYHIENEKFVQFLENHAAKLGIHLLDDTVNEVQTGAMGVRSLHLASGQAVQADLFVDASGFYSLLIGKTLHEPFVSFKKTLWCERAVVGGWARTDEPIKPYTTAETMNAGWCWQIEHETRINRGYVYCPDFISDTDAEAEFRAKNPRVGPTRIVQFRSGRHERAWVDNVVAVGNAAGFVEPLESTSLAAICTMAQGLAETLAESAGLVAPSMKAQFNQRNARSWDAIRRFLGVHYRFNRRLETPFWLACCQEVDLAGAESVVEYYRENGPSVLWRDILLDRFDQFGMEGYLSMLVGQQVPYHDPGLPTPAEQAAWAQIQSAIHRKAQAGYSVPAALAAIRHPQWRWPNGIYTPRRAS